MLVIQSENELRNSQKSRVKYDPQMLTVYFLLVAFGMIAVYSATIAHAFDSGSPLASLLNNMVHVVLAVTALFITAKIPIRFWQSWAPILLVISVLLLVVVLIPAFQVRLNGSARWISIFGWNFQPSEFAELGFIIFAADYIAFRRGKMTYMIRDVIPVVGIFTIFAALLLLEPDLGSIVVLGTVLMTLLFLNEIRMRYFILLAALGILLVLVFSVLEPYRAQRLVSFLNPWDDPFHKSYQLVHSLIAFGRGDWFGVGLGNSVLKMYYLPTAGSDFLFAIIAEEFGFLGVLSVVGLFTMLVWKIFKVSWRASAVGDHFGKVLAQGIGSLIAVSALVNIGVNMGVLPTKGLTLPLMSAGGTSLIACSAAIGLVLAIDKNAREELDQ